MLLVIEAINRLVRLLESAEDLEVRGTLFLFFHLLGYLHLISLFLQCAGKLNKYMQLKVQFFKKIRRNETMCVINCRDLF